MTWKVVKEEKQGFQSWLNKWFEVIDHNPFMLYKIKYYIFIFQGGKYKFWYKKEKSII